MGNRHLNKISPTLVQDWVTQAKADGLAPRSIRKYHVFLSSVFVRAVKDRVLVYNPCDHTELPGRQLKVRYPGVAKINAWLHTGTAALNLRKLLNLGLIRQDGTWAVA